MCKKHINKCVRKYKIIIKDLKKKKSKQLFYLESFANIKTSRALQGVALVC